MMDTLSQSTCRRSFVDSGTAGHVGSTPQTGSHVGDQETSSRTCDSEGVVGLGSQFGLGTPKKVAHMPGSCPFTNQHLASLIRLIFREMFDKLCILKLIESETLVKTRSTTFWQGGRSEIKWPKGHNS